jgi:hypothetical protein
VITATINKNKQIFFPYFFLGKGSKAKESEVE